MIKFIPKLVGIITEDSETSVVVSALESFTNLLKDCSQSVTSIPGAPEQIVMCITKLLNKECNCQVQKMIRMMEMKKYFENEDYSQEEEEEEVEGGGLEGSDEVEQDQMLLHGAGEVLPNLGNSNAVTIKNYFYWIAFVLLLMALKKTLADALK